MRQSVHCSQQTAIELVRFWNERFLKVFHQNLPKAPDLVTDLISKMLIPIPTDEQILEKAESLTQKAEKKYYKDLEKKEEAYQILCKKAEKQGVDPPRRRVPVAFSYQRTLQKKIAYLEEFRKDLEDYYLNLLGWDPQNKFFSSPMCYVIVHGIPVHEKAITIRSEIPEATGDYLVIQPFSMGSYPKEGDVIRGTIFHTSPDRLPMPIPYALRSLPHKLLRAYENNWSDSIRERADFKVGWLKVTKVELCPLEFLFHMFWVGLTGSLKKVGEYDYSQMLGQNIYKGLAVHDLDLPMVEVHKWVDQVRGIVFAQEKIYLKQSFWDPDKRQKPLEVLGEVKPLSLPGVGEPSPLPRISSKERRISQDEIERRDLHAKLDSLLASRSKPLHPSPISELARWTI